MPLFVIIIIINLFVKPEEREMDFQKFMDWMLLNTSTTTISSSDVYYLSAQNDSLRDEFQTLITSGLAPLNLPFGQQVFGKEPDAINLWIGDSRAVSSMHRDTTYENLYCVIRGTKVFHLLPPCCAPFLGEKPRVNAQYEFKNGIWIITKKFDEEMTPWIELDVTEPEKAKEFCPEFDMVADLVQRLEVHAGQTLYLPAGWFHRVTQTEPTIAVNYWYDRDYNSTWLLTETIEKIVESFGGI